MIRAGECSPARIAGLWNARFDARPRAWPLHPSPAGPSLEEVRDLAVSAGFGDGTIDTVIQEIHIPSAREHVRIQLAATPLATLMRERSREQQASLTDAVVADVAAALHVHIRDGALVFPQECNILSAHRIDG